MEMKTDHIEENYSMAAASGKIRVGQAVIKAFGERAGRQGEVLGAARSAGILAARQTAGLIPMCRPLMMNQCTVDYRIDEEKAVIQVICTVTAAGQSGVEMEALNGVNITLLTIYEMHRQMDREMEIYDVRLEENRDGSSGYYLRRPLLPDESGQIQEPAGRPPVLAVSGVKNSGKTTFLCGVLPLLIEKGLKVAVIKHDGHTFRPDVEGTDSWRLRMAGAERVAVYCETYSMIVEKGAVTLSSLEERFSGVDLILLEGLKNSEYPKVEIVRKACSGDCVCDLDTVIAVITDCEQPFSVPQINLNDYQKAAKLIESFARAMQDGQKT